MSASEEEFTFPPGWEDDVLKQLPADIRDEIRNNYESCSEMESKSNATTDDELVNFGMTDYQNPQQSFYTNTFTHHASSNQSFTPGDSDEIQLNCEVIIVPTKPGCTTIRLFVYSTILENNNKPQLFRAQILTPPHIMDTENLEMSTLYDRYLVARRSTDDFGISTSSVASDPMLMGTSNFEYEMFPNVWATLDWFCLLTNCQDVVVHFTKSIKRVGEPITQMYNPAKPTLWVNPHQNYYHKIIATVDSCTTWNELLAREYFQKICKSTKIPPILWNRAGNDLTINGKVRYHQTTVVNNTAAPKFEIRKQPNLIIQTFKGKNDASCCLVGIPSNAPHPTAQPPRGRGRPAKHPWENKCGIYATRLPSHPENNNKPAKVDMKKKINKPVSAAKKKRMSKKAFSETEDDSGFETESGFSSSLTSPWN